MEKTRKIPKNTFKTPENTASNNKKSSKKHVDFGKFSLKWNEKTRRWTALFIFLFSLFTFISFVSHLKNGIADQSLALLNFSSITEQSHNIGGAIGTKISNLFIFNGFGFIALLIPIWMILLALVIFINKGWSLLSMAFVYMAFLLYYFSISMGLATLVFNWSSMDIAGAIGIAIAEWLSLYIGNLGTFILVVLIGTLFVSYHLQKRIPVLKSFFEFFQNVSAPGPNSNVRVTKKEKITEDPVKEKQPIQDQDEKESEKDFILSFVRDGKKYVNGVEVNEDDSNSEHSSNEPEHKNQKVENNNSKELEEDDWEATNPQKSKTPGEISFEIEEGTKEMPVIALDSVFTNIGKQDDEFVKVISEEDKEKLNADDDVGDWELYDPTKDLSDYRYPTIDLLNPGPEVTNHVVDREELEQNKDKIVKTLLDYKIEITHIKATVGPTVTLYEIIPAPGIKISKIKGLVDDIALSLAALGIRIIAPIPGKGTIGFEIPNSKPEIVPFRSVIATEKFRDTKAELPIVLGKTISNEVFIADLTKMPHLLVAGATGQGKSVGLNGIIASILYKKHPSQVKFVLIDPKKVELSLFQKLENHFLAKLPTVEDAIITDTKQVVGVLNSLCQEMDERYDLLKMAGSRNITEYNQKFINRKLNPKNGHRFLPYIVLVIDELADLMMTAGKEVEMPIARLAQLARAIGIHLIVATQRPSVNVITGIIKANFPARMSFRVISKVDSRTILDTNGADQLIGRGDLLFSNGSDLIRIQNPFIDTPEVEKVVDYIAAQRGYPDAYLLPEVKMDNDSEMDFDDQDTGMRDSMFAEAARLIVKHQHGSTSLIQRRLKLGYNRAGRIMDQLEKAGIVGPTNGSKPREVLVSSEDELERYL